MAFPFGAAITMAQYMDWAHSAGCHCQSGYGPPHGLTFVKITAPSGRHVIFVGEQTERLVSSQINQLDRRLGMDSPFDRVREA